MPLANEKVQSYAPDVSMLREVFRRASDAVVLATEVTEAMHSRMSPVSVLFDAHTNDKAIGVTGFVYKSVRRVTTFVAQAVDEALCKIDSGTEPFDMVKKHNGFLSALNGVIGDRLHRDQSPLAIDMALKQAGQPISWESLVDCVNSASGHLTIMIHGLCMNDEKWSREQHHHGVKIEQDLGHTVIYLHYNTGLPIAENGQRLNALLEDMAGYLDSANIQRKLKLHFVAHSMGGLVARSACHYASVQGHAWMGCLHAMIFLGTPHHGAPLAKVGKFLESLLSGHPYTQPLTGLIAKRSEGIKDLASGKICFDIDEPISLPDSVDCFAVAACMTALGSTASHNMIGDGLVSVDSALGLHLCSRRELGFDPDRQWLAQGIDHMDLLSDRDVCRVICNWLKTVKNKRA